MGFLGFTDVADALFGGDSSTPFRTEDDPSAPWNKVGSNAPYEQERIRYINADAAQRMRQGKIAQMLMEQAQGKGPSVAQQQLMQGRNEAMANAMAMQASARGGNPALAARTGQQQQAMLAQGAAGQAAQLRAQEMLAARGQLGQFALGTRGQEQAGQQMMQQQQQVMSGMASAADEAAMNRAAQEKAGWVNAGATLLASSDVRAKTDRAPITEADRQALTRDLQMGRMLTPEQDERVDKSRARVLGAPDIDELAAAQQPHPGTPPAGWGAVTPGEGYSTMQPLAPPAAPSAGSSSGWGRAVPGEGYTQQRLAPPPPGMFDRTALPNGQSYRDALQRQVAASAQNSKAQYQRFLDSMRHQAEEKRAEEDRQTAGNILLTGTGAAMLAGALSDVRAKTGRAPLSAAEREDLLRQLEELSAPPLRAGVPTARYPDWNRGIETERYDYRPAYAEQGHAGGGREYVGPNAQALERSPDPAVRNLVMRNPQTGMRAIDGGRAGTMALGMTADQQRMIDSLQKQLDELRNWRGAATGR